MLSVIRCAFAGPSIHLSSTRLDLGEVILGKTIVRAVDIETEVTPPSYQRHKILLHLLHWNYSRFAGDPAKGEAKDRGLFFGASARSIA